MKTHEFTLVLTADPSEEEADRLYAILDDGTLATVVGVPQICFHRQAESLEDALRSAIADIRSAGLDVSHVEMTPDVLLRAT